jgi:valyl-tRNA synthetase
MYHFRLQHLVGKYIKHPFVDRRFPIIADGITVDMAFGTGAVKITPAHDPNDYECGKRNNLEFINLMNDDGTYNENAGEQFKVILGSACAMQVVEADGSYDTQGMKRYHVRSAILKALKEKGLYVETKDNPMQIPVCRYESFYNFSNGPQWTTDIDSDLTFTASLVTSSRLS